MKYGDTLYQRSIPQWETRKVRRWQSFKILTNCAPSDNVDYNDIKLLIKLQTSNRQGQGRAQTIPGKDNEAKESDRFEEELFSELKAQHQRIQLFVQSKAGEITRRLGEATSRICTTSRLTSALPAHLDKQVAHLELRQSATSKGKNIPVRRLEKFAKAEEEILK